MFVLDTKRFCATMLSKGDALMKKQLLPQVARYFKTNLHTHTTISDGKLTPEQTKAEYQKRGYQILSITDHHVIVDHSALNDESFLCLTGIEVDLHHADYRSGIDGGAYHLNLIAKRPDNLWSPAPCIHCYPGGFDYEPTITYEGLDHLGSVKTAQAMIDAANEHGFLVMYNHPIWSCHSYPDYAPLNGLWAIELRNSTSCVCGLNENNERVFKDMLTLGKRVYPVGADDMHSLASLGQSYIMLGAEKLTYDSVITALENGDFYMSCGPEILELSIEGNEVFVRCSEAAAITLQTSGRFARRITGDDVTSATFNLEPFLQKCDRENMFIYVTVTAADGSYATTRAYFAAELR